MGMTARQTRAGACTRALCPRIPTDSTTADEQACSGDGMRLSLVHPPSAETAPAARSGFGAGAPAGRLRLVLPASRHGSSGSPMSRGPEAGGSASGCPPGRPGRRRAGRRPIRGRCDARRSQEVAEARQGARRRHEAGQGARGRPDAPRRSLKPARAPGGATRRGRAPEAAQTLPGGR
jgi:hypothetical protein